MNNSVKRKRSSPAKVAAERAAAAAAASSSAAESCSRSAGQQNGKGARGSTSSSRGSSKSPTPAAHRRPTNLDLLHTNQPEVSHNNGSGGGVCRDDDIDDDENGNGADEELVAVVRRDQVGENQGQVNACAKSAFFYPSFLASKMTSLNYLLCTYLVDPPHLRTACVLLNVRPQKCISNIYIY